MATPANDSTLFLERMVRLARTAALWEDAAHSVLISALACCWGIEYTPDDQKALNLVNRCFKVNEGRTKVQAAADVLQIDGVFREISLFLDAVTAGQQYFHLSPPGHGNAGAYVWTIGGWKNRKPADGVFFVKPNLEKKNDDYVVDAMMHECAHYCGPKGAKTGIDHATVGGKKAYGALALTLTREKALVNASSYAWLAFLARLPNDQWMTSNG